MTPGNDTRDMCDTGHKCDTQEMCHTGNVTSQHNGRHFPAPRLF
jgi:hypothetical protein